MDSDELMDVGRRSPGPSRNSNEWRKHEYVLGTVLQTGGYTVERQRAFGRRHGSRYVADLVCCNGGGAVIVVSAKWQRTHGSFDEKVPGEVRTLAANLHRGSKVAAGLFKEQAPLRGYVVLGGTGWRAAKRERWCNGALDEGGVRCVDMDTFMELAFTHRL